MGDSTVHLVVGSHHSNGGSEWYQPAMPLARLPHRLSRCACDRQMLAPPKMEGATPDAFPGAINSLAEAPSSIRDVLHRSAARRMCAPSIPRLRLFPSSAQKAQLRRPVWWSVDLWLSWIEHLYGCVSHDVEDVIP